MSSIFSILSLILIFLISCYSSCSNLDANGSFSRFASFYLLRLLVSLVVVQLLRCWSVKKEGNKQRKKLVKLELDEVKANLSRDCWFFYWIFSTENRCPIWLIYYTYLELVSLIFFFFLYFYLEQPSLQPLAVLFLFVCAQFCWFFTVGYVH
jgi:hypothetical protein